MNVSASPKYLAILDALRQRIADGIYGPGSALPSESRIAVEFGASRATVLKSLQALKQDGWIESQQGRATFVRGRPAVRRPVPAHAKAALAEPTAVADLLSVTPTLADPRVAALLNVAAGTPVFRRVHRATLDGARAVVTVCVPLDIAAGTGLTAPTPVEGSVLTHLAERRKPRGDYVTERTTARRPTPEEAELLAVDGADPVLAVTLTVYTATGDPVLTSTLVTTGDPHGTEATYPLNDHADRRIPNRF